jgi:hypothetical protein
MTPSFFSKIDEMHTNLWETVISSDFITSSCYKTFDFLGLL